MEPALPSWITINATCTQPPPDWHVNPAQISVPEPYIYVTNNTGNHAILERCTGTAPSFYVDNSMPADAIGCVLVAHVVKGSASKAWQCFMDARLEGQWGVIDKAGGGVKTKGFGVGGLAVLGLAVVGAVFGTF
ncbi:uncharacterized protein CC84DRAFT_1180184 [Paraphaeosphaeria sporulosa]|uniref:Uncharacterized protein n=1 Tax=Paraphaeosphaeria sporulosa TaxID=1460663 RepID=A0A177C2S6_9PLEO|nr:uncharacterized protein CC84DRAFT_1180184 [Paraphaeosphaeria sporulosa]OAG01118.1 hypothetical protein CC84DRAFT_1180184 [Paraphaeosphaeria sporulosa]